MSFHLIPHMSGKGAIFENVIVHLEAYYLYYNYSQDRRERDIFWGRDTFILPNCWNFIFLYTLYYVYDSPAVTIIVCVMLISQTDSICLTFKC